MTDENRINAEMKLMEMNRATSQERFSKFQLPISILAGLAVVVICLIIGNVSVFHMALWTSLAIVLFWVLGNLVRFFLQTEVFPPPPEEFYDEGETEFDENGEPILAESTAKEATEEAAHDYMARE